MSRSELILVLSKRVLWFCWRVEVEKRGSGWVVGDVGERNLVVVESEMNVNGGERHG